MISVDNMLIAVVGSWSASLHHLHPSKEQIKQLLLLLQRGETHHIYCFVCAVIECPVPLQWGAAFLMQSLT